MAAAALLRSVARKMARAPPPAHPRPLLARQLHGSSRSAPGASLPPPPPPRNEIQIQDCGGNRLVVAMAASGLPSLASKMSRAPPPHHLLHARGLSSSTSPNPPLLPAEKFFYFSLYALAGLLFFWLKPMLQELNDSINALTKERDTLKEVLVECQRKHTHVLQAQSMQASARGTETDGKLSS